MASKKIATKATRQLKLSISSQACHFVSDQVSTRKLQERFVKPPRRMVNGFQMMPSRQAKNPGFAVDYVTNSLSKPAEPDRSGLQSALELIKAQAISASTISLLDAPSDRVVSQHSDRSFSPATVAWEPSLTAIPAEVATSQHSESPASDLLPCSTGDSPLACVHIADTSAINPSFQADDAYPSSSFLDPITPTAHGPEELAYNATGVDSIDGYSPFFLDNLRECVLPMDSMTEPPPKQAPSDLPEWVSRMLEDQRIVYDASSKSLRLHALHAKRR